MKLWQHLRTPLLVLTFANILLVLGRTILDPNVGKLHLTPFVFPANVPLPAWQQVSSQPLPNLAVDRPPPFGQILLSGNRYRYSQKQVPLEITMRYDVETGGDVKQMTADYANIPMSPNQTQILQRQHPQLGFYGLFVYQQRAYLDACINPRGGSTFTPEQFDFNRKQYDFQLPRLFPWLLGLQPLRDKRCLWTHLSVPLNQSSSQSAYATLEKAWFDWYKWWQPRFPPS